MQILTVGSKKVLLHLIKMAHWLVQRFNCSIISSLTGSGAMIAVIVIGIIIILAVLLIILKTYNRWGCIPV